MTLFIFLLYCYKKYSKSRLNSKLSKHKAKKKIPNFILPMIETKGLIESMASAPILFYISCAPYPVYLNPSFP